MGYTHAEMSSIMSALNNLKTVETIIKDQELAIQNLEAELARLQDLERRNMYRTKGIFTFQINDIKRQIKEKRAYLNSWTSYKAV